MSCFLKDLKFRFPDKTESFEVVAVVLVVRFLVDVVLLKSTFISRTWIEFNRGRIHALVSSSDSAVRVRPCFRLLLSQPVT